MSILKDIFEAGDEIKNKGLSLSNRKSISRESNRGILQFTSLIPPSLPLETVTMINKALERNYSSFVVVMVSMDSVSDESSIKDYLGKIHQNPNFNMLTSESCTFSMFPGKLSNKRLLMESSAVAAEEFVVDFLDSKRDDYEVVPYDELSEKCKSKANGVLNEKKKCGNKICKTKNAVTVINESTDSWNQIFFVNDSKGNLYLLESTLQAHGSNVDLESSMRNIAKENINLLENYVPDLEMNILNRMFVPKNYNSVGKQLKLSEADIVNSIRPEDSMTSPNKIMNDSKDSMVLKDVLRDNDVKKANELAPTLLHLKTYFRDNENALHPVDYIVGIKVVAHKINSDSMINNIVNARKKGKAFFNLMKLTTGEISFFKDYVFAIGRIKDEIKTKFRDDPWWNALNRKRKLSKILAKLHLPQQLIPNATIVISMDEAHIIKTEHNIDLMEINIVKDIMDKLFLLGFVIVDSSTEVAYFMFDGRNGYEEYSFNALERENSNGVKDVKNIMQVLGRM